MVKFTGPPGLCPSALSEIPFSLLRSTNINKALKKKGNLARSTRPQSRGHLRETVFADKLLQSGARLTRAVISVRQDRRLRWPPKTGQRARGGEGDRAAVCQGPGHGFGERYNKVVDIWGKAGDEVGEG